MDVNAPEFLMPSAVSGFSANAAEFVPSSWSGYAPSGHDRSHMSSEAPEFVPGKNYSDEMPYLVNSRPADDLSTEARGQGPLATGPLHSVAMTGGIYGVESAQPLTDAKVMAQGLGQWGGDEITGQGGQAAPYMEQYQGRLSTSAEDLNASSLRLAGMREDASRAGLWRSDMSSEAAVFVPGSDYSGMNAGAMPFDGLSSGLEYGMGDGSGGDVKDVMSTEFLQSAAMANALYGVEAVGMADGESAWGQEWKEDSGLANRRWPGMGEDVSIVSRLVRIPQARAAHVIGHNGQTVGYIQQSSQCRICVEQEVPDVGTATLRIEGSCEEAVRKAESIIESLVNEGLRPTPTVSWGGRAMSSLEAGGCSSTPLSTVPSTAVSSSGPPMSPEVAIGGKVSLDILFPNLAAQDHDRAKPPAAPPRSGAEDFRHGGDWAARAYLPPMPCAEQGHFSAAAEDPWSTSGLAESVAAMALGFDDLDDDDDKLPSRLPSSVTAVAKMKASPTGPLDSAAKGAKGGRRARKRKEERQEGAQGPGTSKQDLMPSQDTLWNMTVTHTNAPPGNMPPATMTLPNRQWPAGWQPPEEPPPVVPVAGERRASSELRPPPPFAPPPPPPNDLRSHLLSRHEPSGIALRTS